MITRTHKITAVLTGQLLLLLVLFQFGQDWWLGLIAVCSALLPWLVGFIPQPNVTAALPADETQLSAGHQQALSLIEQILKRIFNESLTLYRSSAKSLTRLQKPSTVVLLVYKESVRSNPPSRLNWWITYWLTKAVRLI